MTCASSTRHLARPVVSRRRVRWKKFMHTFRGAQVAIDVRMQAYCEATGCNLDNLAEMTAEEEGGTCTAWGKFYQALWAGDRYRHIWALHANVSLSILVGQKIGTPGPGLQLVGISNSSFPPGVRRSIRGQEGLAQTATAVSHQLCGEHSVRDSQESGILRCGFRQERRL